MTRVAGIDIGSNTVKILIADRDPSGRFSPVLETSRTTRLGEGIHARRLREAAIRRTLDALREYAGFCADHAVDQIAAVGTSALRDALNRDELVARAREAGIEVEPIPGEEEARLSYLAVRRDPLWSEAGRLLVIDIGGGSTEIIVGGRRDTIESRVSLPLGAVRLTEAALHSDPPTIQQMADANRLAEEALQGIELPVGNYEPVGVGGTFNNLAAVKCEMPERDLVRLHGTMLTLADVEAQVSLFAAHTIEERKAIVGLEPSRADIILGGAIVLCQALCRTRQDDISVSCRGLRWGLLYDRFG